MRSGCSARRETTQRRWDRVVAIDLRFRSLFVARGSGIAELGLTFVSIERCLRATRAETRSRSEIASAIGVACRYGSIE